MKPRRFLVIAAIASLASLLTIFVYAQKVDFFQSIDLKLKDVRFRARGTVAPDPRVVVVAIDGKSVNELGRWPWDRRVVAQLLTNLRSYGARTVALDIVFSEPSNPVSDQVLSEAVSRAGNVIAGHFFREEQERQAEPSAELLEPSKIRVIRITGNVDAVPIVSYPFAETNIPSISHAAVSSGFFNIIPDGDGLVRTANLLILYEGDVYPSLSLAALRHYMGSEIVLDIAPYGVDGLLVGDKSIPVDESGRITLNYYGRQGTVKTISAVDVIAGRLDRGVLKDSVVFVGATEVGIYDVRVTPVDPLLPGVDIHATVTSNVLQNRFLIRNGLVIGLEMAFIAFFPLVLAVLLTLARRTVVGLMSFLGITFIYFLVDYLLFARYSLNIAVIFPVISLSISYVGAEAYRNLVEERQARFLKKAFTSYVSPELVGEIMKNPDILKLGGEKREISVLFSDIRGFTTLSENLPPETLVTLLNQYLGPMTNIVLEHKGTLDKYIGDAIMAIFNAPLRLENHARHSCETAAAMIMRLRDINAQFKSKGLPQIDIGIGINTAEAIVGNMGTDTRFDYTAVGDTVNLAARLEGLNKVYGTHIIISEFTEAHLGKAEPLNLQQPFTMRELDLIKVKGKDRPVTIYELSSELDEALRQDFAEALKLYRQGTFTEAREAFQSLAARYHDRPSGVFAERCEDFISKGVQGEWDGVCVAKTK